MSPDWSGKTVWVIGGGPSLTDQRFYLDGISVGVNRSAWKYGCDVLVSIDQLFVRCMRYEIQSYFRSGGNVYLGTWEGCNAPRLSGARYLGRDLCEGLSRDPGILYGENSGHAALNLAYLKGATDIRLLGFDMQYSKTGKTHCHSGYSWHTKKMGKQMRRWADEFSEVALQVRRDDVSVINYVGEPRSLITAFPERPLSDLAA